MNFAPFLFLSFAKLQSSCTFDTTVFFKPFFLQLHTRSQTPFTPPRTTQRFWMWLSSRDWWQRAVDGGWRENFWMSRRSCFLKEKKKSAVLERNMRPQDEIVFPLEMQCVSRNCCNTSSLWMCPSNTSIYQLNRWKMLNAIWKIQPEHSVYMTCITLWTLS